MSVLVVEVAVLVVQVAVLVVKVVAVLGVCAPTLPSFRYALRISSLVMYPFLSASINSKSFSTTASECLVFLITNSMTSRLDSVPLLSKSTLWKSASAS